jgi:hypothetical protein
LGISFALTVYYKLCNRTRASKYTGIVIYILYVCLFGVSAWADFITGNTITGFACIAAIAVGSVWEVKHNSDFSKEIEVAV